MTIKEFIGEYGGDMDAVATAEMTKVISAIKPLPEAPVSTIKKSYVKPEDEIILICTNTIAFIVCLEEDEHLLIRPTQRSHQPRRRKELSLPKAQ
jgi:hypothetical protein